MTRRMRNSIVMGMVAACCAATALAAGRRTVDLSGLWWLHPMAADRMAAPPEWPSQGEAEPVKPTAEEKWQPVAAPNLYLLNEGQGAWMVRSVNVGADIGDRRFILQFDSLYFRCRLFVNGMDCGTYWGGVAPWQADVTHAIRAGDNLIQLGLTPGATPSGGMHAKELTNTEPTLMYDNGTRKVGLFEEARLLILAPVYVNDIFARPSVAHKKLAVDVEVVNATGTEQARRLTVTVREPDGKVARTLDATVVKLAPHSTNTITVAGEWTKPRLWWPHDPHLYVLRVELASDKSDRSDKSDKSDELSARFGFREITIQGDQVFLNGKKLMLRGGSSVWRTTDKAQVLKAWNEQITRFHVNSIRTHYSPLTRAMAEAADELGLMLLPQGPIWGEGARGEPEFWALLSDQYLRMIKRLRNHPSIVIWSLGNEAGGMRPHPTRPSAPFMVQLMRDAKALDPTRPHTASHDYTLYGAGDLIDAPTQWGFEFDNTFPMAARAWYMYGYDFASLYREKPMPVSDDEAMEGYNHGHASVLVGDRAYLSSIGGSDRRSYFGRWAHSLSTKIAVMEYRRQPQFVSVMLFGDRYSFFWIPPESVEAHPELGPIAQRVNKEPHRLIWDPDVMAQMAQKSLKPAVVAPKDWNGGVWAGRVHERPVIVMNDNFYDLKGRLRWSVLDEQGKVLKSSEERVSVPAVTHQERVLRVPIPDSATTRSWTLRLELFDDKRVSLYEDDIELGVMPPVRFDSVREVTIYPELGSFRAVPEGKIPFKYRVSSALPTDRGAVVVVPRGVWLTTEQWAALQRFVEAGGAALILSDECHPVFFGSVRIRSSNAGTVWAHQRVADHPVLRGLPSPALRYWIGAEGEFFSPPFKTNMPTFTISHKTWYKPRQGNFLPLIDAGMVRDEMGLTQSPLFEVRHGQGRALFSSLLLAEGLRTGEPAAVYLLARSLTYLQTPAQWVGGPLKPLYAVGADLSPYGVVMTDRLSEAGTLFVQADSEAGSALLADDGKLGEALNFARAGGTLLLHRLSEEHVERLGAALNLAFTTISYRAPTNAVSWQWLSGGPTRPYRMDWISNHPLRWGLSQFEIHWCETFSQENLLVAQQILNVGVRSDDPRAVNLTQQGGLLVVALGEGQVVIDQVLWDPTPDIPYVRRQDLLAPWSSGFRGREAEDPPFANDYIRFRAMSYLTQLLSNLDVLFRPVPPRQPVAGEATATAETIGLWHFDEGPIVYDYGRLNMDIPVERKATFTNGLFGSALRMTSTTSLPITRQGRYGLLVGQPRQTVDFYIKPDGARSANQVILAQGDLSRTDHIHAGVSIEPDGRIIFHYMAGGRGASIRSTASAPAGEWTRVTVVLDHERQEGDRTVNRTLLYLNGRLEAEAEHAPMERREPLCIGRTPRASWPVFEGALDELHIIGRALTSEEIAARRP